MVATFFANIAIVSAVIVSTLSIIDWALTERHKNILSDKAITLWAWLDDKRSLNYLTSFKDRDTQIKTSRNLHLFMIFGVLLLVIFDYDRDNNVISIAEVTLEGHNGDIYVLVGVFLGATVNIIWLHPVLLTWVTEGKSAANYAVKSTATILPTVVAVMVVVSEWPDSPLQAVEAIASIQPVYAVALGVFAASSSVLLHFWYINIVLIFLWGMTYLCFAVVRFILVRIVDHPKGVVLGFSALVAAIGSVAKAWLGN